MRSIPTVQHGFAVKVTLHVSARPEGRGRIESFGSAVALLARLHAIGHRRLVIRQVSENGQKTDMAAALTLFLHTGRGLLYFRRKRPLVRNAYTWHQLKASIGFAK